MENNSKILILGSYGLVGSAIKRQLIKDGFTNLIHPSREECDLTKQDKVISYFENEKPEYVFNAAAKVGGIHANNIYPADFIFQNLQIQNNVFESCFKTKVKKLLFLGSSCIYPKNCPQPIKEEYLLTSPLEKTNEAYAIAKIAGLKTAEYFNKQYGCKYYSVMPTNLYGENDNFHPTNSHVIPALIQRMEETIKNNSISFEIWGTGTPKREFLYVDDLADACIFLMKSKEDLPQLINIGSGEEISIKSLAEKIGHIMGYKGDFYFNSNQPDGTMRKVLDVSQIQKLGWKHKVTLDEGLKRTVEYFKNAHSIRSV